MKQGLSELTLAQFIDLECGDLSVLTGRHEMAGQERLASARLAICNEFASIASPASLKSMLIGKEKRAKLRAKSLFYGVVATIIECGGIDDARCLLKSFGFDCDRFDDDKLASVVKQRLNEANFELKRMVSNDTESRDPAPDEIRRARMSEIASVMTALKINIEPSSTNAAIYANLVRQAEERCKSLAKLPPMARMFM